MLATRGIFAFAIIGLMFLIADVLERTVVTGTIRLFPRTREWVLRNWAQLMASSVFTIARIAGGARFDLEPRIPPRAGELIVMNHQSLVDIPILFKLVPGGYPKIMTRARYGRGIPLVSHMLGLYGHLLVNPGEERGPQMERIDAFARTSQHPVVVFPEGHRTRDGEILRWKRGGLRTVLRAREWRVHVLVLDGLWESLSIMEFMRNISRVRCRVVEADCFDFNPETDDAEAVMDRMRERMIARLHEMRGVANDSGEEGYDARPDLAG